MGNYARGKYAWGECGRSGIKMRYVDMVSDGLYPNMMVHPDWYEPPYPIQDPSTVEYGDAIALRDPSPERLSVPASIRFPLYDPMTGGVGAELFKVTTLEGGEPAEDAAFRAFLAITGGRLSGLDGGRLADLTVEGSGFPEAGLPLAFDAETLTLESISLPSVTASFDSLVFLAPDGVSALVTYLGARMQPQSGPLTVDMSNVILEEPATRVTSR